MTVGVIMLVHENLHRAEQLARHWVAGGCPVVIHVDSNVPDATIKPFVAALGDEPKVKFSTRHRCEWGMWGLVAATLDASQILLDSFPEVRHVYLASGACMPLRPVQDLTAYLDRHPDTDFIESVSTAEANWAVDGLEIERFTLRFPFSWRKHRLLFDAYVNLQRRLRVKRKIPNGLIPHIGSQWWCLTRETLSQILRNPNRKATDRFFRRSWIPDETYFQTLSRRFARNLESRSLTLTKFDYRGRPHVFYDDHLRLLQRSNCFVARKIWPRADKLFDTFLRTSNDSPNTTEPQPDKINRLLAKASERRLKGRPGLAMQSRYPSRAAVRSQTAGHYAVFVGFSDLFEEFQPWLGQTLETTTHGHLFAPERVEFANDATVYKGAMSDSAQVRDYNCGCFLRNLMWNSRGTHQSFHYGPFDTPKAYLNFVNDPHATIVTISGAWLLRYFHSGADISEMREDIAEKQKVERMYLRAFEDNTSKAQVRIWTLADFLTDRVDYMRSALDLVQPGAGQAMHSMPNLVDLTGFGAFLEALKNQGLYQKPVGDYKEDDSAPAQRAARPRPYIVN